MTNRIYQSLLERKAKGQKSFAVLIDPDKVTLEKIDELTGLAVSAQVDYLLVGGSLVISNRLDEVVQRVRETGVDGVLVGRAVLGAPWFFQGKEGARASAWREGHEAGPLLPPEPVSLDRRFAVLLDHARQFQSLLGPRHFHRMRKHLGWYCKGFSHAAALRARMFQVSSVEELESVVAAYQRQGLVDVAPSEPVDDLDSLTSRCS